MVQAQTITLFTTSKWFTTALCFENKQSNTNLNYSNLLFKKVEYTSTHTIVSSDGNKNLLHTIQINKPKEHNPCILPLYNQNTITLKKKDNTSNSYITNLVTANLKAKKSPNQTPRKKLKEQNTYN